MKKSGINRRINRYGYFFILPFVITFIIFNLYPIVYTFQLSTHSWKGFGAETKVGFSNFLRLAKDSTFPKTIINTLKIWLCDFIPQLGIALLLSLIFSLYKIKGMKLFRAAYYLPNLITAASIGLLFNILLNGDKSTINQLLVILGFKNAPIQFFKNGNITQAIASYILWWMWFGYTTILVMAGISTIEPDLYEASEIDGCSKAQTFTKITLPLIKPTLIYITITSLIGGMQIFDVPVNLTNLQGDPQKAVLTSSMYIYQQGFKNNSFGYASALSVVLFFIIALLSFFAYKAMNNKRG